MQVNRAIFDQVDIFQSDFYNRITGLTPTDVAMSLTLNNTTVVWPLVDGAGVQDGEVASGKVYWNQLSNGAYGIRFYPNAYGLWTLNVGYPSGPPQLTILRFDVANFQVASEAGLRAGFCV